MAPPAPEMPAPEMGNGPAHGRAAERGAADGRRGGGSRLASRRTGTFGKGKQNLRGCSV